MLKKVEVRNVNNALYWLRTDRFREDEWRRVAPRGQPTLEYRSPVITVYEKPMERVLFDSVRDANPFFHFFEALWILDGRSDVKFLAHFNKRMAEYSDDGELFHAAYGERLRYVPGDGGEALIDQIVEVIKMLRKDPDTRQAVLQIWRAEDDLGVKSKDIPCNDMVFLKIRDGRLQMTVMCRSNDAVWGAYGANAVQFSTLQDFIAGAVGVEVGRLFQYSDSFHVYENNEVWKRIRNPASRESTFTYDYYSHGEVWPYPTSTGLRQYDNWEKWLTQLREFMDLCYESLDTGYTPEWAARDWVPYIHDVAIPMWHAHWLYKEIMAGDDIHRKNHRITWAIDSLTKFCHAADWRRAGVEWLQRRLKNVEGE